MSSPAAGSGEISTSSKKSSRRSRSLLLRRALALKISCSLICISRRITLSRVRVLPLMTMRFTRTSMFLSIWMVTFTRPAASSLSMRGMMSAYA